MQSACGFQDAYGIDSSWVRVFKRHHRAVGLRRAIEPTESEGGAAHAGTLDRCGWPSDYLRRRSKC